MSKSFDIILVPIILSLFLAITFQLQAQDISKKDKTDLIKELTEKLEKYYTSEETGIKLNKEINRKFVDGEYDLLNSTDELTQQLTEDLIEISNDTHFLVFHDPERGMEMLTDDGSQSNPPEYAEEARWKNYGFKELKILEGGIGYLNLTEFYDLKLAAETASEAMNFFSDCNGLIIDLRYNGGGSGDLVEFLAGYFFDTEFAILLNIKYSKTSDVYWPSMIPSYVPGKKLNNIPLYVLTSKGTASAAEGFAFIMSNLNDNATIVGETTAGAENPIDYIVVGKEFILRIPSWSSIYSKISGGWEAVGITPDIETDSFNALKTAHLDLLEKLKSTSTNDKISQRYKWSLDGVKAEYTPAIVDEELLKKYAGKYGNRDIYFENGKLLYQYKGRTKREMNGVTSDYFVVEGYDWFRIKFNMEDNRVTGMEEIQSSGQSAKLKKD
ncbi:MAG: S41 family peptidase [bacterium]